MSVKNDSRPRGETVRRIAIGVAWGVVPTLFIAWLGTHAEGPMGAGARAIGILERVMLVALASAIVGVAGLFGMRLLRLCRVAPEGLFARFVLGAGLGLGVVALATLGLGCAGLARAGAAAALLGAMFLAGLFELRAFGEYLRRKDRARAPLSAFELALVLAMLVALAFQLVLAFNLPTDYDACEYHMAAPWRWAQLGRIDYIEGNVYTNLPMNAEMLYFFSMELAGGASGGWDGLCVGVHLGVVMNLMAALIATGAVYVLARRFWSRRAALVASALFFTMPWTMVASTVFIHVEVLLAAWATLAVYALLEFRETRLARWAILSAVFAGLAGGVKYTALAFFVPVGAAAVWLMWPSRPRLGASCTGEGACATQAAWPRRIATALLYAAVVLVVVGPWFAKNYAFTGNPVFPFAYKYFGGRDWSPELDWKWYAGNFKAAQADQAGNLFVATWERLIWPKHQHGSAAIALFALFALAAWRDNRVRWLWALLALWTLLWYFGTHRVDRFWLPFAGIAAALAGCAFVRLAPSPPRPAPLPGEEGTRRKGGRAMSAVLTALLFVGLGWQLYVNGLIFSAHAAGNYDLLKGNERFLEKHYPLYPLVWEQKFAVDKPGAFRRLVMVGEAQTLYLGTDVRCSTVFNEEVFTKIVGDVRDSRLVARGLRGAGIDEVFVNWLEVARLRETYRLKDREGRSRPGLPDLSPLVFKRLVDQQVMGGPAIWKLGVEYPKAKRSLPGFSPEETAALPDGRIAATYLVTPAD